MESVMQRRHTAVRDLFLYFKVRKQVGLSSARTGWNIFMKELFYFSACKGHFPFTIKAQRLEKLVLAI